MKRITAILFAVAAIGLTGCGSSGNTGNPSTACRYIAAHMNDSGNETDPMAAVTKMRDLARGSTVEAPANELYDVAVNVAKAQNAGNDGAALTLGAEVSAIRDEMAVTCSSVGVKIPALAGSNTHEAATLPACVEKVDTVFTYDQVIAMTQGCKDSTGQTWTGAHGGKCADGHAFAYMPVGNSDNPTTAVEVSVPGPGKSGKAISVPDNTAFNQFIACNPRY